MSSPPCRVSCLVVLAALAGSSSLATRVEVGDLVRKDVLISTLPPDSLYEQGRELVRATSERLSTMRTRIVEGTVRGAALEHREVFIAMHARPGRSYELFDRGVAAVREDSLFRVVYLAESDPGLGYVGQLKTLEPPGSRSRMRFLHVRYVQTGTGYVTEDLLFALHASDLLVEVPIVQPDLDDLVEDGEDLCCGRFSSFDDDLIEHTVFVTRDGRHGITHRIRSRFSLEGRFELDSETNLYVPRFRLVAVETSSREPWGNQE